MNKILILGGSHAEIPLIKSQKSLVIMLWQQETKKMI